MAGCGHFCSECRSKPYWVNLKALPGELEAVPNAGEAGKLLVIAAIWGFHKQMAGVVLDEFLHDIMYGLFWVNKNQRAWTPPLRNALRPHLHDGESQ